MAAARQQKSLWFASNPSKRWMERFLLYYSPTWMFWLLCIIVPFRIYEHLGKVGYLAVGVVMAAPCVLVPMLTQNSSDKDKPLSRQYWLVANVWIAMFSFVGNYVWTHYFYVLLGAAYTFPSWQLNKVPIGLYLMTHAYFCFYHALANVCIRRVKAAVQSGWRQQAAVAATVFVLAYTTALMETVTIAHFPYYTHKDKGRMYTVGSLFYAIYFFVSFPMFYRIGEVTRQQWTVGQAAMDSLGACMLVTLLLDFWRLAIGAIADLDAVPELPWMQS